MRRTSAYSPTSLLLILQVVHEEGVPRLLGFDIVDAYGWSLPPGALLTLEPGARASLRVKWTPGASGAVRELLHLRWGAAHLLAVGLSGTATAPGAAASTAAASSAKLRAVALHPTPDTKHAAALEQGAQPERGAAVGDGGALPRTLTAPGPARRLALGVARRVDAGAAPSPAAVRERDMPRAAQAPLLGGPGRAGTGERRAGTAHAPAGGRADDCENTGPSAPGPRWKAGAEPGVRAVHVLAQAGSGAQNQRAHATAGSPGSSAASSATAVGAGDAGGRMPGRSAGPGPRGGETPRRGGPMGPLAARRHADAPPHTPRRPSTPGASSAASAASAAQRPVGASLRLGRGRVAGSGHAGGPETSVAVRKSFSFAHKGLWLEKQERALAVWLNSLLAPGAGAGADAAHPNPDTLATGRLAAQLKGLLCRRAAAAPLYHAPHTSPHGILNCSAS